MPSTRFILVGQGIAGSMLAYRLLKNNIPFLVMDKATLSSASKVAAGLMNPIVFRHLTLSWKCPKLFQQAESFYRQFDTETGESVYHPTNILRVFGQHEAERWKAKIMSPGFDELLDEAIPAQYESDAFHAPYGFGRVKNAAWVDTLKFVSFVRNMLRDKFLIIEEEFDYQRLVLENNGLRYENLSADAVIFCEGHLATHNPWFQFIPFRPVKGEVLTIRIKGLKLDQIVNKDVFILPLGDDLFRVGSTYDWADLSEETTPQAVATLTEKLKNFLLLPFEVVEHQAGIRPAVADRRPVVGQHPLHPQLFIFNGLGAKGAMLAPAFSADLCLQLLEKRDTERESDPKRFASKINL